MPYSIPRNLGAVAPQCCGSPARPTLRRPDATGTRTQMERILRACRPRTLRLSPIPGQASQPSTVAYGSPSNRRPASEAQKRIALSSFLATLTHSLSRNSFACHSYANTRDMGVTPLSFPAVSPLCSPCLGGKSALSMSFRINTCRSVASKRLYPPLESTLAKNRGEGGYRLLHTRSVEQWVPNRRKMSAICIEEAAARANR
jgi:hypothetical protein